MTGAKKIVRKNTRKSDEHRVFIDGKEMIIKTSCKTFGQIEERSSQFGMNPETGDLIGKCKNCAKQRPDVAEGCLIKSDPKGWDWTPPKNPKRKTKRQTKPSVVSRTAEVFLNEDIKEVDKIYDKLCIEFPGRNIKSTIASALSVLKHVEVILEKKKEE